MTSTTRELLTAAELARCCQVDMKTIHNWAARGDLPHFRTPGRHLRFHRADALDFLRRYGYPIPEWLLEGPPSVVALGAPRDTARLELALAGDFTFSAFADRLVFLVEMGSTPPDVAVLIEHDSNEPPLSEIVGALRAHPRTRRTRLVTAGTHGPDALRAGATVHLPTASPGPVRDTLVALLGLARVTD